MCRQLGADFFRVLLPLALMGGAAAVGAESAGGFDRSVYAMGTQLELHLDGDGDRAARASERAIREIERIEQSCSTWRSDSAWTALNRAEGRPVRLAPEWIRLLQLALDWSQRTDGTFDPVLAALMRTWGIREGGRVPSDAEVRSALAASGRGLLELDLAHATARLRHPSAGLEEGGFVKGYALDQALEQIRAEGIPSGWLNFGGQILAWGQVREVEIATAEDRQRSSARLSLRNASLASSGTAEHGRHILDPRSGKPSPAWGSVSVVAASALATDVLSTALYVMGPDRGLSWADAQGVAAVFQPVHSPARLSRAFRSLKPTFFNPAARPTP